MNIYVEKEGIRIYKEKIGQRLPEFTLVDYPLMMNQIER